MVKKKLTDFDERRATGMPSRRAMIMSEADGAWECVAYAYRGRRGGNDHREEMETFEVPVLDVQAQKRGY